MDKRKLLGMIVMVVVVGLAGLTLINLVKQWQSPVEPGIIVGKRMQAFKLQDLDDQEITVGEDKQLTVINFWATWCPPCREEMPGLHSFYQKNKQKVNFYAVNIQEPVADVRTFIDANQYTFPVLLDSDAAIAKLFQVNAIPTTLVVDQEGIIQYRTAGMVSQSELETIIGKL